MRVFITHVSTGRACDVSFFYISYASDGYCHPRRASKPADIYPAAGIIFNVVFGQYLLGAPVKQPLVRQAQLGASYRVQVSVGQSLASSPYRVLRDWEG